MTFIYWYTACQLIFAWHLANPSAKDINFWDSCRKRRAGGVTKDVNMAI